MFWLAAGHNAVGVMDLIWRTFVNDAHDRDERILEVRTIAKVTAGIYLNVLADLMRRSILISRIGICLHSTMPPASTGSRRYAFY
jgi:hypothetical protein